MGNLGVIISGGMIKVGCWSWRSRLTEMMAGLGGKRAEHSAQSNFCCNVATSTDGRILLR